MADSHPAYLSPSELGTKDYWETYYARTLAHISHEDKPSETEDDVNDEDDPGTSWFSEHNAPQKVLRFLTRKSFPLSPRNQRQASVLDLGTGNGSMLALLRKKGGYKGDLVGVDYSRQSVELARELQRNKGHAAYHSDSEDEDEDSEDEDEESEEEQDEEDKQQREHAESESEESPIRFEEWDILGSKDELSETGLQTSPSPHRTLSWFPYHHGGFDIVLDKGTFDAVSLSYDAKTSRVCERYADTARRLVKRSGFLIVTTCNWTEEELVHWFTGGRTSGDRLTVWGRVEYPVFRFGGHEGQGVCTVCFQRVGDA